MHIFWITLLNDRFYKLHWISNKVHWSRFTKQSDDMLHKAKRSRKSRCEPKKCSYALLKVDLTHILTKKLLNRGLIRVNMMFTKEKTFKLELMVQSIYKKSENSNFTFRWIYLIYSFCAYFIYIYKNILIFRIWYLNYDIWLVFY